MNKPETKPLSTELRMKMERVRAEQIGYLVLAGDYQLIEADRQADRRIELPTDADLDSVVTAVLAVGQERKKLLDRLRAALTANQQDDALTLARELCNLQKGAGHGGEKKVH